MVSANQFKTLEEKRNYVVYLIVNNKKKSIIKFLKKNEITLKDLINLKGMDILIFSIENNASYNMIKYIAENYDNLNYSFDFKLMGTKNPLYSAITNNKFKIADLLISRGADINFELNYLNILYYLDSNNLLNKSNLKYILNNGFNARNIDSYLINNFNEEFVKIVFKYAIFDNAFILRLLGLYKDQKPKSKCELFDIIYEEKNKIEIDNDFYTKAIGSENYSKMGMIFHNDNDKPFSMDYLKKYEANFQKMFTLFEAYDRDHHTSKKYDFVKKYDNESIQFKVSKEVYNQRTTKNMDKIREDIKDIIKENDKDKLTDYINENNVLIRELNTEDFDLLIYALENIPNDKEGLKFLIFLLIFGKYRNLNYYIGEGNKFKTPLTTAIGLGKILLAESLIANGARPNYKFVNPETRTLINCLDFYYENKMLNLKNLDYMIRGGHSFPVVISSSFIKTLIVDKSNNLAEYFITRFKNIIDSSMYRAAIMSNNIEMVDILYENDPRNLTGVKDIVDVLLDLGAKDEKTISCLNEIKGTTLNDHIHNFLFSYRQLCV